MPSLAQFILAQTQAQARAQSQRHALVSGLVLRLDGGQVLVNVGDRTLAAQPILGQQLQAGDRVWLQMGSGQPRIIGLQGRDNEVTSGG